MIYFPAFFDLKGQAVLIVGGGEVALRKVTLLERTGAALTLVAPAVAPALIERATAGLLDVRTREFVPADLDGMRLVVVATAHRELNRWIARLSEERRIPVNVVDDREASRFIVPALIDRDPVLVAVSTGGASPVLARRLRERLEALIPKRLGAFALWLRDLRTTARKHLSDAERRRFLEAVIDGSAARRFFDGDMAGAAELAQGLLRSDRGPPTIRGEVILVGAGPGDPELLTLKALRALQDADVILHDRLVPEAILDLARRDAARICVGKSAGASSVRQEDINAMLIERARAGRRVVRLKGGDPFIFGRGGEELEALAAAGIRFSVIPGITAALGCAAYAGIPLTHRDHAHSVTLVTGHADGAGQALNWRHLAAPGTTTVFYMGLARLHGIVERLLEHGALPACPAAIVEHGTLASQRVVVSTLGSLLETVAADTFESPALLVVGEVAALASELGWFNPVAAGPAASAPAPDRG